MLTYKQLLCNQLIDCILICPIANLHWLINFLIPQINQLWILNEESEQQNLIHLYEYSKARNVIHIIVGRKENGQKLLHYSHALEESPFTQRELKKGYNLQWTKFTFSPVKRFGKKKKKKALTFLKF